MEPKTASLQASHVLYYEIRGNMLPENVFSTVVKTCSYFTCLRMHYEIQGQYINYAIWSFDS